MIKAKLHLKKKKKKTKVGYKREIIQFKGRRTLCFMELRSTFLFVSARIVLLIKKRIEMPRSREMISLINQSNVQNQLIIEILQSKLSKNNTLDVISSCEQ